MKNALRASGAAGLATTTVLTALAFGPPAGALPSSEPGPAAVTTHPAGTERASVAVTASATFADDVRTVVQVAGTARAGATITVRRGDDVLATTTADASGAWTTPVNAPNTPGVQALTVVQSVDGTETRIPLDVDYGPGVVVTSPPDGSQLTPGEALQVAGTAPSGTEVVVHEQGRREVLGTARADAGGGWRVAVDGLENRSTTLVAEGITKGYNRTAAELRVAPAPVQPAAPTKVSGYFPPDNSAWAHITGEGITPGALVQIKQGTTLIASGTATGTTFDLPIDPSRTGYGAQDFTVTQTVDGIESDSTPVTLDYGQNAATFTSPTEGAQVPGTPLQFTGTGTPGADIEIHGTDFTQDTAIATATVKPDGTWTATNTTITLPQGPYQFWTHQHTKGGKVGYSHVTVTVR
jgi:hypothetical protein